MIRVRADLFHRAEALAKEILPGRRQGTAFVERCVSEMIDLIDSEPENRGVPDICLVMDALRLKKNLPCRYATPFLRPVMVP